MKNKKNGRNKRYSSFEKRCRKKNGYFKRQKRKVIWDIIILHCSWNCSGRIFLLLLSFSTRKHTSMAFSVILLNFFEEQSTQNHLQYLSGCLRVLFPTIFFMTCNFQHNGWIHLDHTRIKAIQNSSGKYAYVCKQIPPKWLQTAYLNYWQFNC